MAGPTFCPHSLACWGEIAQRWGCGYCRRWMSVTIQKETLAFYDYCLCVPPLKPEWGELSMWHFWFSAWWLASSRKGCTDIFLLHRRYTDAMPKPRGLCPTMPRLIWESEGSFASRNIKPCLSGIWRDNICIKVCRTDRLPTEFKQYIPWKQYLQSIFGGYAITWDLFNVQVEPLMSV